MLPYVSYVFYRLFGIIAPHVPDAVGYWFFARLSDLFYHFDSGARRAVFDNLRHVLGEEAQPETVRLLTREVFHNQGKNYFDLFRLPSLSAEEIKDLLLIEGWKHLEAAVAEGRGIIALSAHFGNVDALMQFVRVQSLKSTLVAERLRPPRLHRYVWKLRAAEGIEIIPVDGALKGIFRALDRNELVALAADRDITESGIEVDLFGAPARLPDGYAKISRRTGAPILPAFVVRQPDDRFRVFIQESFHTPVTEDRKADVRMTVQQVASLLEEFLGRCPDQWVVFRPIWTGQQGQMETWSRVRTGEEGVD